MSPTQRRAALFTAFAVLAITAAVVVPGHQRTLLHSHGRLHPWFHVVIFGALAVLASRSARSRTMRLLIVAAVVVFGGATEYAEHWEFGTPVERRDILLDTVGALFGTALSLALWQRAGHRAMAEQGY